MRWGVAAAVLGLAVTASGCGFFSKKPAPIESEPGAMQTGIASWYGPGFHGKRTANGEVYDQNALTAAHRTLPHGTRVEVTNLENERRVRVRINDRGPYVDDRVIDLSHAAAQRIGLIGPGVVPVRVTVLAYDAGDRPLRAAATPPVRGARAPVVPPGTRYALHVGTYADYERARREQRRLGSEVGRVHLALIDAPDARYYQLRVGPFTRRDEAVRMLQRLATLGVPALVVTSR